MNNLFLIQILSSFLIGGILISALTFWSEKLNSKLSGIVVSFPTTVVLGFIFLSWVSSPEIIPEVAPTAIAVLGATTLFTNFYSKTSIKISRIVKQKIFQIALSFLISSAMWIIISSIIVSLKISLPISIFVYFILMTISHLWFKEGNKNKTKDLIKIKKYNLSQKIFRGIFVGIIVVLITILSKTLTSFWGSVFSVFPAAFSSVLMIYHFNYGTQKLSLVSRNMPIGSISILIYILGCYFTFPIMGVLLSTLISLLFSLITSVFLFKIKTHRG